MRINISRRDDRGKRLRIALHVSFWSFSVFFWHRGIGGIGLCYQEPCWEWASDYLTGWYVLAPNPELREGYRYPILRQAEYRLYEAWQ
jgi:hypothetical protein